MAKYLKEFWLLRTYQGSNDLSYTDVQFNEQTRCVTALFERYFGKLENREKCWRLNIVFVENRKREKELTCCETFDLQIQKNIEEFYKLSHDKKKIMALELLREGYERVIALLGYPREQFDNACQAVKDCQYINQWIWKRKFSSDKKLVAEILCEHEIEYFRASLIIKAKDGTQLDSIHLFDAHPHEFCFVQYLGELKWLTNGTIEYASGRRKSIWTYDIKSKSLTFQGEPVFDYKTRWKH